MAGLENMARSNSPNFLVLAAICFGLLWLPVWMGKQNKPVFSNTDSGKIEDFSFTDIKGKTHHLSDFKDKTILLHIWASWCPPCVSEFPSLLQAVARNENVVLIALSVDRNERAMHSFIYAQKAMDQERVLFVADPDQEIAYDILDVNRYPETFILRDDLSVIERVRGERNWLSHSFSKF